MANNRLEWVDDLQNGDYVLVSQGSYTEVKRGVVVKEARKMGKPAPSYVKVLYEDKEGMFHVATGNLRGEYADAWRGKTHILPYNEERYLKAEAREQRRKMLQYIRDTMSRESDALRDLDIIEIAKFIRSKMPKDKLKT